MIKNPMLLAALTAVALAVGACGSGKDNASGDPKSRQDKAFEGALKFAKCMRDEGIEMPDPKRDANGGISQVMRGRPGSEAKVQAAQKKCQHFMDVGGGDIQRDPAEEAKHRKALLDYAKCMRQHGIDMPDPKFEGDKVQLRIGGPGKGGSGPSGPNPESAAFKAADKACRPILAKVGDDGPGFMGKKQ